MNVSKSSKALLSNVVVLASDTVRKVSNIGVGVERTFHYTPRVAQIEVVRYGKVRRATNYTTYVLHW